MTSIPSIAISAALIGSGALICAVIGNPLVQDNSLRAPLNAFGINRSPYGEVFAMAMQGPIDQTFNHTFDLRASAGKKSGETPAETELPVNKSSNSAPKSITSKFRGLLEELAAAKSTYTNPKPSSPAQKLHIRRDVENKLRFAYNLDPANYGNYNAYHFFITEPQLGTRPELTPGAAKLAQDTIDYCLRESYDPRPALTAAAAATNILHLMFNDRHAESPRFTQLHMRHTLDLVDHCLARHEQIHQSWTASGGADLLSPMRIVEMDERYKFIRKIRDAAAATISRLEGAEAPVGASS